MWAALDKQQFTFKALTSTTAVTKDLIISAYKPNGGLEERFKDKAGTPAGVWDFVATHLKYLPVFLSKEGQAVRIEERTPRALYDRMVAYHVQRGVPVPLSSAEFQAEVVMRFAFHDGMVFLPDQAAEHEKKRQLAKQLVQQTLFVEDEQTAIQWLRQRLTEKPQTYQDIQPDYLREIQHIAKHELLPVLDVLLAQNFLVYNGEGPIPSQIHSYLSTNYQTMRNLDKHDASLVKMATGR